MKQGYSFWLVYTEDGRNPSHRHHDEAPARKEADRLALINPGKEFFVVQATYSAVSNNLVKTELSGAVPF